uniref:Secreted protein n=1 Tax=Mesocestoides corti TaxID=53468 RepID=A0A5K3FCV9_MESCO
MSRQRFALEWRLHVSSSQAPLLLSVLFQGHTKKPKHAHSGMGGPPSCRSTDPSREADTPPTMALIQTNDTV